MIVPALWLVTKETFPAIVADAGVRLINAVAIGATVERFANGAIGPAPAVAAAKKVHHYIGKKCPR